MKPQNCVAAAPTTLFKMANCHATTTTTATIEFALRVRRQ